MVISSFRAHATRVGDGRAGCGHRSVENPAGTVAYSTTGRVEWSTPIRGSQQRERNVTGRGTFDTLSEMRATIVVGIALFGACGGGEKKPPATSTTAEPAATPKAEPTAESAGSGGVNPLTPDEVCDHVMTISVGELKKLGAKITDQEVKDQTKKCVADGERLKKDDRVRWDCESTCSMSATKMTDLEACEKKCKPKP